MNSRVFRPRQFDQVLRSIVKRVLVDVVDHPARGSLAVRILIHNLRPLSPHVRFGNLHECSLNTVALVSCSDLDSANRLAVIGDFACLKGAWLSRASTCIFGITTRHRAERSIRFPVRKWGGAVGADVLDHSLSLSAFAGIGTPL